MKRLNSGSNLPAPQNLDKVEQYTGYGAAVALLVTSLPLIGVPVFLMAILAVIAITFSRILS